jgi:hypothetical protein
LLRLGDEILLCVVGLKTDVIDACAIKPTKYQHKQVERSQIFIAQASITSVFSPTTHSKISSPKRNKILPVAGPVQQHEKSGGCDNPVLPLDQHESLLNRLLEWQLSGGTKLDLSGCSLSTFPDDAAAAAAVSSPKVTSPKYYSKPEDISCIHRMLDTEIEDGVEDDEWSNGGRAIIKHAGNTPKMISSLANYTRSEMLRRFSETEHDGEGRAFPKPAADTPKVVTAWA